MIRRNEGQRRQTFDEQLAALIRLRDAFRYSTYAVSPDPIGTHAWSVAGLEAFALLERLSHATR